MVSKRLEKSNCKTRNEIDKKKIYGRISGAKIVFINVVKRTQEIIAAALLHNKIVNGNDYNERHMHVEVFGSDPQTCPAPQMIPDRK